MTYNFNGRNYIQEYDEGQDVLHPTVVSPAVSGATFLGWTTSKSGTTALTSLTMGSDPITLYALFKYNDVSETFGQTYFKYGQTESSNPSGNPTYAIVRSGIDLGLFYRYNFYTGSYNVNSYNGSFMTLKVENAYTYLVASCYCGFRNSAGTEYGMNQMAKISGGFAIGEERAGFSNQNFSQNISASGTANFVIKGMIEGGNGWNYGYINVDGTYDANFAPPKLTLYGKTTTI